MVAATPTPNANKKMMSQTNGIGTGPVGFVLLVKKQCYYVKHKCRASDPAEDPAEHHHHHHHQLPDDHGLDL
jgi:hypothetical protein